jgi:hypothetical protein
MELKYDGITVRWWEGVLDWTKEVTLLGEYL